MRTGAGLGVRVIPSVRAAHPTLATASAAGGCGRPPFGNLPQTNASITPPSTRRAAPLVAEAWVEQV